MTLALGVIDAVCVAVLVGLDDGVGVTDAVRVIVALGDGVSVHDWATSVSSIVGDGGTVGVRSGDGDVLQATNNTNIRSNEIVDHRMHISFPHFDCNVDFVSV